MSGQQGKRESKMLWEEWLIQFSKSLMLPKKNQKEELSNTQLNWTRKKKGKKKRELRKLEDGTKKLKILLINKWTKRGSKESLNWKTTRSTLKW